MLKQKFLSDNSSTPCLEFYIIIFLLLIICIETFTHTFHCHEVTYRFIFEFENDGMEQSKCYSFISLLFILKCLSKTLVIRIHMTGYSAVVGMLSPSYLIYFLDFSLPSNIPFFIWCVWALSWSRIFFVLLNEYMMSLPWNSLLCDITVGNNVQT